MIMGHTHYVYAFLLQADVHINATQGVQHVLSSNTLSRFNSIQSEQQHRSLMFTLLSRPKVSNATFREPELSGSTPTILS